MFAESSVSEDRVVNVTLRQNATVVASESYRAPGGFDDYRVPVFSPSVNGTEARLRVADAAYDAVATETLAPQACASGELHVVVAIEDGQAARVNSTQCA